MSSLCALLLPLLLYVVQAADPSPGCSLAPDGEVTGLHWFEVTLPDPYLGEVRRSYDVYVPASIDDSEATPFLLDFHGYTANSDIQFTLFPWRKVADEEGFIYVAMGGMNDVEAGGSWGSWNVSRDVGPLGKTCDPSLHQDYPCYNSCGDCSYLENSCDWTSCHDDVAFTEAALLQILSSYCVDTDKIHMSGASNGGMFIWTQALAKLSASLASVAPVCSSPLRAVFIEFLISTSFVDL